MAKTRHVNTRFWDDDFITELSPNAKLLFLYCLTNPLTDLCGAYEITWKRISFDTGLEVAQIQTIMAEFEAAGKVAYRNGWIVIRNFGKHQQGNSPNVQKGRDRALSYCPDWIKQTLSKGFQSLPIENALLLRPIGITYRDNLTEGAAIAAAPESPNPEPVAEPEPDLSTHPAIVAIRDIANAFPPKVTWPDITGTLGLDIDAVRLKQCFIQWRSRGYKPINYGWATDWYINGIPPIGQTNAATRTNQPGNRQTSTDRLRDTAEIYGKYPTEAELRGQP